MVGLDAEGVDLSRLGRLSLLQLSCRDSDTIFLLDVLDALKKKDLKTLPLIVWLKVFLEDPDIVKVLHEGLWNVIMLVCMHACVCVCVFSVRMYAGADIYKRRYTYICVNASIHASA